MYCIRYDFFKVSFLVVLSLLFIGNTEVAAWVHHGDLEYTSQADLDTLDSGLTEVTGKLKISEGNITDISKLADLEKVGSEFEIKEMGLTNLDALFLLDRSREKTKDRKMPRSDRY